MNDLQVITSELMTDEKKQLLKNTVCKGASDAELELFIHVCIRTGLDPFMKQIYSIARGGVRTIQTSIDGLRLIAERTERYTPGREPTFTYNEHGHLISSTAYIKKRTSDGIWHEISATAFFNEYNPGNNPMWKKMPHVMLAKCAESAALRRAFPANMSGLYCDDEMTQAKSDNNNKEIEVSEVETLEDKEKMLEEIFKEHEISDYEDIKKYCDAYLEMKNKTMKMFKDKYKENKSELLSHVEKWKAKQEELKKIENVA